MKREEATTALVHVLDASEPVTTLASIPISVIGRERRAEDSLTVLDHIAERMTTDPPEPTNP